MRRCYYNKTTKELVFRINPLNYLTFLWLSHSCGIGIYFRRYWSSSFFPVTKRDRTIKIEYVFYVFGLRLCWNFSGPVIKDYPGWPKQWEDRLL